MNDFKNPICRSTTATDWSRLPARDNSLMGSTEIQLDSSLTFPKDLDTIDAIKFQIPESKLFIDPLQVRA